MEVQTRQIPHARCGRRRWQAQVQALPPHIVLAATGEDEPAVVALRALPSMHALRAPLALPYGPDDQVRKVQAGGWVSFQGRHLRVPKALRGQAVAFRPTATDGSWAIRFLTDDLRTLDPREPAQECSPCLRTPVHHVSGLDTSTHLTTSVLRM